ncbi:MAG: tetraacyldisaccharide 4'-kinase [Candidatus Omnitrophota bacterium]
MYLLLPFSIIYFIVISARNLFYNIGVLRSHSIGAKVISVGNITWGGTGKTPVAAFIVEALKEKNHKAAILIRGYGKDEPKLFSKLTPETHVLVGKDRVKTGREVIENYLGDAVVLDDGFQYRRLKRDLDIVCVDAVNPFGNGFLIPAGSLREGLGSLKRADIFLITKSDLVKDKEKLGALVKRLKRLNKKAVIAKAIHRPLYFHKIAAETKVNIDQLKSKELALVSAIGSPYSFEKTIKRLGLKVNKHFMFRDHHWYSQDELRGVMEYCRKNGLNTIVTTEKDAVKLAELKSEDKDIEILALQVKLEIIENEQGFYDRLFGVYSG